MSEGGGSTHNLFILSVCMCIYIYMNHNGVGVAAVDRSSSPRICFIGTTALTGGGRENDEIIYVYRTKTASCHDEKMPFKTHLKH